MNIKFSWFLNKTQHQPGHLNKDVGWGWASVLDQSQNLGITEKSLSYFPENYFPTIRSNHSSCWATIDH